MSQSARPVGIIANPASGKDIRRLVAHGSTFDNNEKANIVRRVLLALDALQIPCVHYMPDTYGIVPRAANGLDLALKIIQLEMPVIGNAGDSREAALRLADLDVACMVTLGGDGTNRVVASGAGSVPILPISTGTNNVFPQMVEGTLAGLAAAAVGQGAIYDAISCHPRLDVVIDGKAADLALVDVVRSAQPWTGSRAFWKAEHLQEIVISRITPSAIGVCGLGPTLFPEAVGSEHGVYIRVGEGVATVRCAIGPGLVTDLAISGQRLIKANDTVAFEPSSGTIALDGEREIELSGTEEVHIRRVAEGPRVVNIEQAMHEAARNGLFTL